MIYTAPSSPIDLAEVVSERTASSITFTWKLGDDNGGSPVYDYRVRYDQGTSNYIVLAQNLLDRTYTATGLTAGTTYSFKVESQNADGYSPLSAEVSILCATYPETPAQPSTTVVNNQVIFNWDAPVDNGLEIIGYYVYIRQSDLTYIVDRTLCDGLDFTVITNTECTVDLD